MFSLDESKFNLRRTCEHGSVTGEFFGDANLFTICLFSIILTNALRKKDTQQNDVRKDGYREQREVIVSFSFSLRDH